MLFNEWKMSEALKIEHEEGREEGCANLQNALSSLLKHLKKAGRDDEFEGAITDSEKARALFREFGIPNPYS